MITILENVTLLDTREMAWVGERHVVVEGGRIVDVESAPPALRGDRRIDARGRYALPGFVDAHVHHVITTMNFGALFRMSATEKAIGMARLAEATVRRGFTTVRDTGGDVAGLVNAIAGGLCRGPRIVRAGRALSQTGGHGDLSLDGGPLCACQIQSNDLAHVADGPDAVRLAARKELKAGAGFIKIMASGGVASPTDPFDSIQYTSDEIRAITTETDHRHTYTTAHAYQPESIAQAIEAGVRCIEHGNLIDDVVAARMAGLGVVMVPTLVTYQAMAEIGSQLGLPARNVAKNEGVFERGRASIEVARRAGVRLGLGTDLLGEAQTRQNQEFAIRAELEPAADVLRSMYHTNVRLCDLEGEVGVLEPDTSADLVLTAIDPLRDLQALADPDKALELIMCRGDVVVDRRS